MMNYTEMMNKLPPPSSSTLNKTILKIIEQDKRMTPQKPTFMSTTMMMTNVTNNNNNNNNQTHQYPMTPPPKLEESLISTYDISKYIDSEDEEEQEKIMEQRKDKRIPKWAAGRSLLIDLRQQYCQNGKQLDEQANRLYSYSLQENNNVQIDLDVIGLPVIPRYRNRTSSIIWTKPPISPIISNTNYNNSYANLMSEEEEY
ncbi:hypothetical protein DERP_013775 [Dermatophagoides pteronyssinus]|uniref:Inner centromere protein ARK-binding domain-containing protein n=1 Tax=Dermatophagoides pteronyssinus TaxID=6956 RepID=A0ABQ8JFC1_DERPT|nr:hypothetical protein DERP_013775 [Dermatophagoides pteronyssinus]